MNKRDIQLIQESYNKINEDMNNRALYMLQVYNYVTDANLPETEEGYNQAGRSHGIADSMLSDEKFIKKLMEFDGFVKSVYSNVPPEMLKNAMKQWIVSISRAI